MRVKFLCGLLEKNVLVVAMLLFILGVFSGCASTPTRPESRGVIFRQPSEAVQKAAVDALVVTGFDVKKAEPLYVEGFRPRKFGLFVGSGGETVGVWLEPIDSSSTRVTFDTAKSFVGGAGQKDWNAAVLEEMERILSKTQ